MKQSFPINVLTIMNDIVAKLEQFSEKKFTKMKKYLEGYQGKYPAFASDVAKSKGAYNIMGNWVKAIYDNFPICKDVGQKKARCA